MQNNEWGQDQGDKDPWGRKGRNEQGPPDLDEAFRKLMDMIGVKGNRGGSGGGSGGGLGGKMSGGLIVVGVAAVTALWAASGIYQVDQQERGVVLRLGEYHETVMPGLH